jgi:hypothetical protein
MVSVALPSSQLAHISLSINYGQTSKGFNICRRLPLPNIFLIGDGSPASARQTATAMHRFGRAEQTNFLFQA